MFDLSCIFARCSLLLELPASNIPSNAKDSKTSKTGSSQTLALTDVHRTLAFIEMFGTEARGFKKKTYVSGTNLCSALVKTNKEL